MKAKVLITFIDKETKKKHQKGEIIDVTAKRFNEITGKGRYLQLVEEKEPIKA